MHCALLGDAPCAHRSATRHHEFRHLLPDCLVLLRGWQRDVPWPSIPRRPLGGLWRARCEYWSTSGRTPFAQSNLSVSSAVVNPPFFSMSKRAGESFAASASVKQKPFHCTAMIARRSNEKNAGMDYHAVPPPDYKAEGGSKREELCQQDLRNNHHKSDWSIINLWATGCRERSVKRWRRRKFILRRTLMENNTSEKFDDPAKSFSASETAGPGIPHDGVAQHLFNIAICSQFTSDCSWSRSS